MTSFVGRSPRAIAITLAIVAVLAYVPAIAWGVPYASAPDRIKTPATDEILPLEALAEMHNTFVTSKPDRNYGYPWWHYFVTAAAQAPYLGYLSLTGRMAAPTPSYPFGFGDPVRALRDLTLIGRLVSVFMGAGIVVASFLFTRTLFGQRAGVWAGTLTLFNHHMVYYSRTGNLDVPAFFWMALGFVVLASIIRAGVTTRKAVALGVLVGIAMGTKDQALALFFPLALIIAWPGFNQGSEERFKIKPIVAAVGASAVAYLIATGMIVDPQRHLTHVYALFFDREKVSVSAAYLPSVPRTWSGTLELLREYGEGLTRVMSVPVLLAATAGAAITIRRHPWTAVLLLPFISVFVLLVWAIGEVQTRYFLPLTLFVDLFAALALVAIRESRLRALFVPALLVLVGTRVVIACDLTDAQLRDTRRPAAEWFRAHARAGERVEYFGDTDALPALEASIAARRVMGRELWKGQFDHGPAVLEYLSTAGPEFLIIVPDWTTSDPSAEFSGDCPPEVFEGLISGRTGYRLVAEIRRRSFLPEWLQRPRLDYPSVSPPLRVFARNDIAVRVR